MKKLFALAALLFASPAFATDPQFGAIRIEAAPDIRHAFVSTKNQGADSSKVSVSEWNAAHVAPAVLIASVPTGFVWPAQPAAVTEFCGASTSYRWRANLTSYSTIRLTAQIVSAGAATAALRLQYTTDTTGATGWDYLDGVSGPSVTINDSGVTVSATVSIATAAKADVLLRLVGINGDGAGGTACYSTIKTATATLADSATTATTTTGNAATATALAANGANCSAGSYPLGVDASGAAESCTVAFSAEVASGPTYCADAGASDAYACNLSPAPASYAAIIGVPLTFKANTVNTGAATISFNSLGAQAIVKVGATTTTALVTNDIRAGALVTVQWDGANFECLSCNGNYANLAIANTWALSQTFTSAANFNHDTTVAANHFLFVGGGVGGLAVYTIQTPDTVQLLTGAAANSLQVMENADAAAFDFQNACTTGRGTVACTDPTFIIHSHNQNTAQTLSFAHNAANAVIYSGLGPVALAGVSSAVASATALPLPTGNIFHVTGTTTITSITSTGLSAGITITLIFDGALTFTDGNNLKLAGNFVTTADDTITLVYDGTNFYEVARSVN